MLSLHINVKIARLSYSAIIQNEGEERRKNVNARVGKFQFKRTSQPSSFFCSTQCVRFIHIPYISRLRNNGIIMRRDRTRFLFTFDFGPGRSRRAQVDLCIKHFFPRRPIRGRGNTIILTWDLYTHLGGEVKNDRASSKVARETRRGVQNKEWRGRSREVKWEEIQIHFLSLCKMAHAEAHVKDHLENSEEQKRQHHQVESMWKASLFPGLRRLSSEWSEDEKSC